MDRKFLEVSKFEDRTKLRPIVKKIDFIGDDLIVVKNQDNGKVYTGVGNICNGLGLTKGQKDRQVVNIQNDLVLSRGCFKFEAGVIEPNNEVLGIDLEFLPLWLAKISITPKMKEEQPWIAEKLIQYQIKAKDVLAQAFIPPMSKELQAIFVIDGKQQEINNRVTKLENTMTIDYSQQEELRTLGTRKVVAVLGGKGTPAYKELNKKAFSSLWRDYKRVMDVNSYKNTAVKNFEEGRHMIINWEPDRELQLMIKGANSCM